MTAGRLSVKQHFGFVYPGLRPQMSMNPSLSILRIYSATFNVSNTPLNALFFDGEISTLPAKPPIASSSQALQ